MTIALMTVLSRINPFSTSEPETPTGADAVRTAVSEVEGLKNKDFTATLGEPDVVQEAGHYFNEPKVVVPIYDAPYNASDRLVFDLPENRNDPRFLFNDLLDILGVSFENMEDIEGDEVPVDFYGGNATVSWKEVDAEPDKGAEGNGWEKEDIEHVVDDDDEGDDGSPVNVEETTISADDEEDDA
jgi:hypothetical protein